METLFTILAGIMAVLGVLSGAFMLGKRQEKTESKNAQLEFELETTKDSAARAGNANRAADSVRRTGSDRLREDDGFKRG